jgi:hypothetical protein
VVSLGFSGLSGRGPAESPTDQPTGWASGAANVVRGPQSQAKAPFRDAVK